MVDHLRYPYVTTCMYPDHKASTGFVYGCRCGRCYHAGYSYQRRWHGKGLVGPWVQLIGPVLGPEFPSKRERRAAARAERDAERRRWAVDGRPCVVCGERFKPWSSAKHPGSAGARCRPCYNKYAKKKRNARPRRNRSSGPYQRMVCPLVPDVKFGGRYHRNPFEAISVPRPYRRKKCAVCCGSIRVPPSEASIRVTCGAALCREVLRRSRCGPMHGPILEDIGDVHGPAAPTWGVCEWCDRPFPVFGVGGRRRKYCSALHYNIATGRAPASVAVAYGDCRECGVLYCRPAKDDNGFCSARCSNRSRRRDNRAKRRAHRRAGEKFTLREIAERDGWRCHLCGKKVPDREYAARDRDPTIDHLVPVAHGGEHTRANVALAHNRCNWERSDAVIQFQMRLPA